VDFLFPVLTLSLVFPNSFLGGPFIGFQFIVDSFELPSQVFFFLFQGKEDLVLFEALILSRNGVFLLIDQHSQHRDFLIFVFDDVVEGSEVMGVVLGVRTHLFQDAIQPDNFLLIRFYFMLALFIFLQGLTVVVLDYDQLLLQLLQLIS
jgi:hypothetical protein